MHLGFRDTNTISTQHHRMDALHLLDSNLRIPSFCYGVFEHALLFMVLAWQHVWECFGVVIVHTVSTALFQTHL